VNDADALAELDFVSDGLLLPVADREGVLVTDELVVFVRVREGDFVADTDALVVFVRVRDGVLVADTDALVVFVRVRERVALRLGVRDADGVALRDDPRLGVRDGLGRSMRGVRSSRSSSSSSSLFSSPLATLQSWERGGCGVRQPAVTTRDWRRRLRQL
jgi:hypothetical protein